MLFRARHHQFVQAAAAAAAVSLAVTACSVGTIGGETEKGENKTQITILTQDGGTTPAYIEAMITAFEAKNADVDVTMETQPGGNDGDNLIKTKLATGEMPDVFTYNSGSLLKAINPDQNLVSLSDQEWVSTLSEDFKTVVSTDNGLYGAPIATTQAGGVLYNKPVYERLGLKIPTTWAEFMANNEKIKADGKVAPIEQSYGETWTAQVIVLADFANVAAQDPEWAAQYTVNKRKYVQQPALQSFLNLQEIAEKGLFNKDFASAMYDDGVKAIATGTAAHYPMLTSAISPINQNYPENAKDVGVFAMPAQKAEDTRLAIWLPNAAYIPKTTEGAELEAAKKFVAFINSPEGCEVQNTVNTATGPFATTACSVPAGGPPMMDEIQTYIEDGKSSPALEFLSPVKGPNLSQITVEIGSKIKSGEAGAGLYDEDVKKQAQQLDLEGW